MEIARRRHAVGPAVSDAGAPLGVGVIGCGSVSNRYFRHLPVYDHVRVVGCADVVQGRAAAAAGQYGIPRAYSVAEMLADPDVALVVILTPPQAHVEVILAAIRAGKHVYSEKPLAIDRANGAEVLQEAAERGVMVGCAPGHLPRRGHTDEPRAHRRGRNRRTHRRVRDLHEPGPRALAPQPGLLLPARRGAGVRHGAVLLHGPRRAAGAYCHRHRARKGHDGSANERHTPGRLLPGRGPDPRGRAPRVRSRATRDGSP